MIARDLARPGPAPAWLMVAVGVVLVAIACWAVPSTIQAGDAGELSTVMLRGGVPHPSGYPWIRILGLVARPLAALGLPPAMAAALPCALAGVAGWLLLYGACARGYGPLPAAFAVLLAATSAPVAVHASDAEVWGPLVVFAGLVLHVASRPTPRPLVLGLALGLAVSHHLTAILLAPVAIGAAWPPRPPATSRAAFARALGRRAGLGLVGGVLGLLPYVTLAIGKGGAWRWGDVSTLGGLLHHVSRADYGSFSLSLHTESIPALAQWARSTTSVGGALTAGLATGPILGAIAIAGLALAFAGARTELARPLVVGIGVATLGSLLGLPAAFNLDPASPFAAWILERFDVLTIALAVPALAAAAGLAASRMPSARARALLVAGGAVLVASSMLGTAARGLPSSQRFVQRYAIDLLRTPPPHAPAIVLGTDDHRTFPVLFAHEVLGEGHDVLYIDASLLAHAWYRARLREQLPWLPDVDQPLRMLGALWDDPAHRDTPVYLANVFSRPAAGLPKVPEGILWRVIAPHDPAPDVRTVIERHLEALDRYGTPPAVPDRLELERASATDPTAPSDPWTSDLWAAYHEGHGQLVSALRSEGRGVEADALEQRLHTAP